jgi:hypothetical protein
MILTKTIKVNISHNNFFHYKNHFENIKIGDTIEISTEMLPIGSHKIILSKCDICGGEKNIEYRRYLSSFNNGECFTCNKCKGEKSKRTNLEKYGDENYHNAEKTKETNFERYGVDNVFQSDAVKRKIKETNIEKYGVEFTSQVDEFKTKSKETNLKKYGFEHHLKNKDILKKQKETNLERYGVEHLSQNKIIMENIIKKSKKTRENTFFEKYKYLDIKEIDYENKNFTIKCDCGKEHYFNIDFNLFYNRKFLKNSLCVLCNPIESTDSNQENNLYEFIKENYEGIILKNSKITKQELDIYLPELKLAFEFNGLYWHSEFFRQKNYHLIKTELCEKFGIHLIHVYEDQWIYKQDIVKSRILNLFGKSDKIFARKCLVKEIKDNKLIKDFLNKNHIQGFIGSKIKIGLFYNDELVSLMTFGGYRKSMGQKSFENSYEMIRFCNKINTNVIGGASRLFKYFVREYKPNKVISYADRSWSQGDLYKKLDFELSHKTKPNYYYFKNKIKYHRFGFRKDKLVKNGSDSNKTENQIMIENGFYKIYDSGNLKFIWTF